MTPTSDHSLAHFDFRGPEPAHLQRELRAYGQAIKKSMPQGWGYTLLMFDLKTSTGSMMYLSSAKREDMIAALKELIDNLEHSKP